MNTTEIEDTAGRWLLREEEGTWSEADHAELNAWLDASTAHTVAYLRLKSAWAETRRLKALSAGVPPKTVPDPQQWQLGLLVQESHPLPAQPAPTIESEISQVSTVSQHPRPRLRSIRILALAAVLAGLAIGLALLWPHGSTYQTPVGGVASVPMADGSAVTLNTDTQIRVALSERVRAVELTRGEAYFEVAKDATRPFVVTAGNKRVIAVGTRFSVEKEGSEVRVRVTEGTVRMESGSPQATARSQPLSPSGNPTDGVASSGSADAVLLPAGSVARSDGRSVLLERHPLPDVEEDLSWRTGFLIFHDVPLGEAVREFNRYNARQIVLDERLETSSLKVSGKFRTTNFEAFVRLLKEGFPVTARESDAEIRLSPR